MAQSRLLDKCISLSDTVADLSSDKLKLFYTWSIPQADDLGFLPASIRNLKGSVMPLENVSLGRATTFVDELINVGLYIKVTHEEKEYIYVVGHPNKQKGLKKDRQPGTILPIALNKDPKTSWKLAEELREKLINQNVSKTVPNGRRLESEVKRRDIKIWRKRPKFYEYTNKANCLKGDFISKASSSRTTGKCTKNRYLYLLAG